MQLNNNNLKIAIQKQGRLTSESIKLLQKAGFRFKAGQGCLFAACQNFPLDILFVRDDDIPEYVARGVCDLGIVGLDIIKERQTEAKILVELGFSRCSLDIAVPRQSGIKNIKKLENKKIATSYPNVLQEYLRQNNIKANIIQISGSVEIAPGLGIAQAICDLVSTGKTLKANNLVSIITILKSQAILIASTQLSSDNQKKQLKAQFLKKL
jgi:ATP phosphoribosyltransferase